MRSNENEKMTITYGNVVFISKKEMNVDGLSMPSPLYEQFPGHLTWATETRL
jgi:hypothetical protein